MKHTHKLLLALVAMGTIAGAQAQSKDIVVDTKSGVTPYLIDSRNVLSRSGTGLCWRTGYWTKDLAQTTKVVGETIPVGCFCEKELFAKEVCEPPKPAPAAAPAPAPAPVPAPVPVPAPAPAAEKVSIPADALFEYDKAVITSAGQQSLSEFAGKAKGINLEVVIAVGHADRIGSDTYNQKLSEQRAAAVKDFLVAQGIEANRVYTEGKGESQPTTGDTCKNLGAENGRNKKLISCLAPDRRVDLEAVGTKK
ncbi:OmpA family protein [Uliginosibacterium sp. H1]|uniref:OmpA family protein n=1 Tax=Uliginosibacterium sp. H1 TaxID=3114757 RepID=UPI002E16DFA1|nr:OmpA family protein [Uliginosibacterium sp. H1]